MLKADLTGLNEPCHRHCENFCLFESDFSAALKSQKYLAEPSLPYVVFLDSRRKNPWLSPFFFAEVFPWVAFGPVDFLAFFFAANLAALKFLPKFIARLLALGTALAVAGERILDLFELWRPIRKKYSRYTNQQPGQNFVDYVREVTTNKI